jgi:hypothetical protein
MKKTASFLLFLCLLFSSLSLGAQVAQEAVDEKIDSAAALAGTITPVELKAHLNYLASDELEGRETGTPGNKKAAEYISSQFQSFGLPRVGENGKSYYQKVAFTWSSWKTADLFVNGKKYRHLWDFISFPTESNSLPILEARKVIFLGYGIDDPAYSDYEGVMVEDQVILIYKGEPKNPDGTSYITGTKETSDWTDNWKRKLEVAREKGVRLVLFIEDQLQEKLSENRRFLVGPTMTLGNGNPDAEKYANHCFLSTNIARDIMGKRLKKVVDAREKIQQTGTPARVKLKAKVNVLLEKDLQTLLGENVLGYIEGSDPERKDELVVITAHYDHLGRRGDAIYNGADDNASGTSTVIEVAEAFAVARKKGLGPRRSVLVMLVTGEEKGLLGSQFYVNHPVFPLENTIANVNVDMVGRVDDKHKAQNNPYYTYVIGADRLSTELHEINESVNKQYTQLTLDYTYNEEDDPNRYYYRSDHYNFAERGIPAVFFFSGTHADYHRTSDTAEKINYEKMARIGQLVFHTAWELANREKRIEVDVLPKER